MSRYGDTYIQVHFHKKMLFFHHPVPISCIRMDISVKRTNVGNEKDMIDFDNA